ALRVEAAREQVVRPVAEEVRGDRRTDEPDQDEQDDVDAGRDGELVAPEAQEHALPVTAGTNSTAGADLGVSLDRNGRGEACAGGNELWMLSGRHGVSGKHNGHRRPR